MNPPKTLRYCGVCEDIVVYVYQQAIGHSVCKECGWHYVPTLYTLEQFEKLQKLATEAWRYFDHGGCQYYVDLKGSRYEQHRAHEEMREWKGVRP